MTAGGSRSSGEGLRTLAADAPGIEAAAAALAAGRLVLHPTETVVSLSGDPARPAAVGAARRLKGYGAERPFLCLVADQAAARRLVSAWPPAAERLARAFWPGPLTLVLEAGPGAPPAVVLDGKIAMRPASDRVSRAILEAFGGPIFSTSANRRGRPPPIRVEHAARDLAPGAAGRAIAVAVLADEPVSTAALPSTLVDVTVSPARLVRSGALDLETLRGAWPDLAG